MVYWKYCVERWAWVVPWWVCKCLGAVIEVDWLFSDCLPGPLGHGYRKGFLDAIMLRFLYLIDAVYLYQIDHDMNKHIKFDWDTEMVSHTRRSLQRSN